MNYRRILTLLLILVTFYTASFAQAPTGLSFQVSGKVVEKETNVAMEYCTISMYSQNDSSLINGSITNKNGFFSTTANKPGTYYIVISFIGFKNKTIKDIKLNPQISSFDAGTILLSSDAEQVKEVEIIGTKSTVRYELDKKVVSVDKNLVSESGTAVDVLATVPSVSVSLDGTVSLRGSSNFLVLINGQPTQLDASEALQQIPANSIKNIEIITNPSARFEAGNSGGILNIILKSEKLLGTSGMISVNGGTFNNYGGSVNIKHNINKFSFDFSASLRNGSRPSNNSDSVFTSEKDRIYTVTDGQNTWGHTGFSFNYGIKYEIIENHSLSLEMVYGRWGMRTDNENTSKKINISKNTRETTKNINDTKRGSPYFGPSLSYAGTLKNKTTLSAFVSYSQRNFKEEVSNSIFNTQDEKTGGSISSDNGLTHRTTAKIDIMVPIKTGKLEFGGQSKNRWNDDVNENFELDINSNDFVKTDYNNYTVSNKDFVYGLYASYGNTYKKLSYSAGFRAEYTDRSIHVSEGSKKYDYFKWHYFPTAHLSFNFTETHQIYASYSTRINRPRGWFLQPGYIKTGVNSYFQGNPEVIPTIVNSFELGWNKTFKKNIRVYAEAFYKYSQNVNELVTKVQSDNTTLARPYTIGDKQNIGLEANLSMTPVKFWEFDLMGTAYYNILKGSFEETVFDNNAFQWSARLNNFFNITKTTQLQFTARFNSRELTALGFEGENFGFDLGLKQSFLKRALNVTLNARNIFNTDRRFGENMTDNYYYSYDNKSKWPMINLAVSYRINNYKPQRKANMEESEY